MPLPSSRVPSRHRSRPVRRRSRLQIALTTAVVTGLGVLAAPAGNAAQPSDQAFTPAFTAALAATTPSTETPGTAVVTGARVVTLVTGDRVRVTTYSDGRVAASILPGSPHAGQPAKAVRLGDAYYVIPQLPVAELMKLDVSLFDVTALLGQQGDQVHVAVTFASGVRPHAVPGLTLDIAHARTTADGSTVVPATYAAGTSGVVGAATAWRGVTSVALPAGRPATVPAGYRLHTLTVHVVTKLGHPVRFEEAWVMNVDDGALFSAPMYIVNGVGKVSVPEGDYAVIAGSFTSLLTNPDFPVTDDTVITMSLADATVRPTEAVPGFKAADQLITFARNSARRGGFAEGFLGFGRLPLRLQQVPADLPHGSAYSAVSATMAPTGEFSHGQPPDVPSTLAYPKDYRSGVPASMSFTHPRADFAVVPERFHANNPAGLRFADVVSYAPFEFFGISVGYHVHVPGVRTVLLLGNSDLTWSQTFDAVLIFGRGFKLASLSKDSSYTAGVAAPVDFAHGPVGPGQEAAYDRGSTGPRCLLCRSGNQLRGLLPLFDGAGSGMFGILYNSQMGAWKLNQGVHTVAHGYSLIAPRVTLPAAPHPYTLSASSHPGVPSWQLSTNVSDVWRFSSGAGTAVVPLLMPSYVVRTTLGGALPPGATHWRLDFGNLGPVDGTVTHATVSLSTDGGQHWHPARLTRLDKNSFGVSYANPAGGSNAFMSLRVTGVDAGGRSVSETAIHAYRLEGADGATSSAPAGFGPQVAGLGSRACAPATETRAGCYAVVMSDPGTGALLAGGEPAGWGASDLQHAYDIPDLHSDQTVAVVVAYDYPTAEADLATYRRHFGLPACTTANGCFSKINERGQAGSYPDPDPGWSVEAALDMEMISAACPTCHIVLAEADQPLDKDLAATTDAAVAAGAKVTNHSYGIGEHTGVKFLNAAYDHHGVTAVAASGDAGYGPASFPASSPDVIAVGGTVLHHADSPRGWRENAWRYGGSGCSAYFDKPGYQHDKACGMRTYSDLAAVAYGVAVYNSYALGPKHAWLEVAGTSISSPLVAGLVGAAGAGGIKPGSLYGTPGSFFDTHLGSNGFCQGSYLCTAKPGYDGPTGWGTPRGLAPFSVG